MENIIKNTQDTKDNSGYLDFFFNSGQFWLKKNQDS